MKTQSTIHSKLKWKTCPAKGMAYPSVNLNQTVDAIKQSKNKARVGQCHWRACCKYWAEVNWEKIRLTGSFPGFAPLLLISPDFAREDPPPRGNKNKVHEHRIHRKLCYRFQHCTKADYGKTVKNHTLNSPFFLFFRTYMERNKGSKGKRGRG